MPVQVDPVGCAGAQPYLKPVCIPTGLNIPCGRVTDSDDTCGQFIFAVIIRHGLIIPVLLSVSITPLLNGHFHGESR